MIIGAVFLPGVREQAQLLRLLRLARIVRLVRYLPDARILLLTVVKSIPSLFSMVVLTLLLLFVYGMVGWSLFGAALPESWGTIGRSMLTLFILLTLENFPTYLAEAEAVSPVRRRVLRLVRPPGRVRRLQPADRHRDRVDGTRPRAGRRRAAADGGCGPR